MNKTMKILILLAIFTVATFGQQQTLSTTTLSSAVTSTTSTTINLPTSTMLANGPNQQVNTVLYVDREMMYVISVTDSTHVVVKRGAGTGAGAIAALHASGALVYYSITQTLSGTILPATNFFSLSQPNAEVSGTCTATLEKAMPKIYSYSGDILYCANGSSGGQWITIANGTLGSSPGKIAANFCTGSLGSAETEYLNGAACSGATTATAAYVVPTNGTLYGLYVNAGTAVTGGTNKDVLTVYIGGTASAITCTFATGGAATTCSDTTHSAAVTAGQIVQFKWVTATSDAGANISAAVGIY
jgi:hypothetical protein